MKDSENLKKAVESLGGEFELIRELGRGATAVVYLLKDHALDRDLAMKVIRTTLGGDDEALARLQREAKLVAQLQHPNIVKLYGTHRLPDGSLALLMEHVPGRNLKELLQEGGALSIPNTLKILTDVASALAYAHRRRIVHRDVKPENIYIDEEVGAARLADFGVARPWDQDARLTLPGASLGTPAYMSPEQIDGLEVDGRSDVYSLGLVGYEMLLGHHPWEGENVFTIIYRQKNEEIPVEALNLADAPSLAKTLKLALEKDPQERPESAVEFLKLLSEEAGRAESLAGTLPHSGKAQEIQEGASRSSPADIAAQDALEPVDWSKVDVVLAEAEGGKLELREVEEEAPHRSVLGARPRRKWALILPVVALILAAGSYGAYQWLPIGGGLPEDGGYVPPPETLPRPMQEPAPTSGTPEDVVTGLTLAETAPTAGRAGSLLRITGELRDEEGNLLPDTLVLFEVDSGDGELISPDVRTNSQGRLELYLQLPIQAGSTSVLARVPGAETLGNRFEFEILPGPPERLTLLAGTGQTAPPGEDLPDFLGVRVTDDLGNPISGVEVRLDITQGGGFAIPSSVPTDDVGRAFFRWRLGSAEGPHQAVALIPDGEAAPVTFRATAQAPTRAESVTPTERPGQETAPPPSQPTPRPPEPVEVVTRTFAIGGSQVCHLSGGRALCRGANDRGQGGNGSVGGILGLAAGISHGCGLGREGEAWCWGGNESGQLGDGSTSDNRSGVAVDTELRFSVLAAGLSHTCGLGSGGQVYCWGRNVDGQLGDGSRDDHRRPEGIGGGQTFQDIVAGWNHTCGIAAGRRAFCWGSNSEGQLGDGFRVDRLTPTLVPGGSFQSLSAGANHTCGISGDEVLCWGDNSSGQLGDGSTESRLAPVRVNGLPARPLALASGAVHTCALLSDRSVFCWGQNLHGQLGDGTTTNRSYPVKVSGDLEFVAVFAGGGVTCGFTSDGSEYCWGMNQSGQLGDGSRTSRSGPVRVGGN